MTPSTRFFDWPPVDDDLRVVAQLLESRERESGGDEWDDGRLRLIYTLKSSGLI